MAGDDDEEDRRARRARTGVPLGELRSESTRLRAEAQARRSPIPEPVEPESTSQVGRRMFDARGAVDVERFAEVFADRIAARVKRDTTAPIAGLQTQVRQTEKRSEIHDWLRFGLGAAGILAAILGAWNNLRDEVSQRPTADAVEHQLEILRGRARDLDAEQRTQRDLVIKIEGALEKIDEKLVELKENAAARPRKR